MRYLIFALIVAASAMGAEPSSLLRTDRYGDPLPPGALLRLGTERLRLGTPVRSLEFSPDGTQLLTCGQDDGRITLWDARTGKRIRQVAQLKPREALFAVFSPDGKLIAGGGPADPMAPLMNPQQNAAQVTGKVYVWEARSGKCLREFQFGRRRRLRGRFSPDGKVLAVGSDDGVAPGSSDGAVVIWDVATGAERHRFEGGGGNIAFSPDGRLLAAGGGSPKLDQTGRAFLPSANLQLWDWARGKVVADRSGKCNPPRGIIFFADGNIASAGFGPSITVWNYKRDQEHLLTHDWADGSSPPFWSLPLASAAGGTLLASGGADGTVRLWDLAAAKETKRLKVSNDRDPIMALACAPDGRTLAAGTTQGLCSIWDLVEEKEKLVFDEHRLGAHAALSRDGSRVATGSMDGTIRIWDLNTGRPLLASKAHEKGVQSLAFGPGQQLVSGGTDGSVLLWDLNKWTSRERVRRLIDPQLPIAALDFSSDGKSILAVDSGAIIVWRAEGAGELCRIPGPGVWSAVLTPNGRQIVASTVRTIELYDVGTGKQLATSSYGPGPGEDDDPSMWLAMSPDGASFASAGHDKTLRLWDLPSCKERRQLVGHSETPSCIAFSPDGWLIATADVRGSLLLWEVASGQIVYRLVGHPTGVNSVAFAPDGRALLTAGSDTTALLWNVDPLVADANSTSVRTLDVEQFTQLWRDLAAENAATAYRAGWHLSSHPAEAVVFLHACLKPTLVPDPKHIRELISALDDNRFDVREKASRELETFGDSIEAMIRAAQKSTPSLEARHRLDSLIAVAETRTSPSTLRDRRAIGVLERIGTRDARELLQLVAGGVPDAGATRDARASLDRLARDGTATIERP
jgi:WD40 repeat protein